MNAQLYLSTGSTHGKRQRGYHPRNTDLVNHGSFAGTWRCTFYGDKSTTISGSQYTAFNRIVINKASIDSYDCYGMYSSPIQLISFSGHIDLNGKILDPARRYFEWGEGKQPYSRAWRRLCGSQRSAEYPAGANPGNLGAVLSSGANLGNVLHPRGHRSQNNTYGLGYSIQRYYEIIPANNTNLNATFRFSYFNSEPNGIPRKQSKIWNSADTITGATRVIPVEILI